MHHVLRAFFQNARKPGGLSGRIMLWAMNWGHASLAKWGRSHVSPEPDARAFCKRAMEYDLLMVPGDDFECPGYVRLAYCVAKDTLERSLPVFKKLAQSYGLV